MAFRDTLNGLTKKARDQAAEHKDELKKAVDKAQQVADKRTSGKYHDKIEKAGAKADQYIDTLQPGEDAKPDGAAGEHPEESPGSRNAG